MSQHTINIGRKNIKDPFYRYKMPILSIKNIGKGNGIKTELINIEDISRALSRDQESIMKFLAYELGTIAKRNIINGKFDESILNDILDKYITKYVICNICENPETFFVIKKKILKTQCKACGKRYEMDINHKYTDYILRKFDI